VRAADLTVIIPTRDRWPILARTLEALAAQTEQGFDTIVVVDGTEQPVPPELERNQAVRVVGNARQGPGAARNLGARLTDRPLLLFLGDDMLATPTLAMHHLARHRAEPGPEVAVLGHVEWHPEIARNRLLRWLEWSGSQFEYRALAGRRGEDVGFGRFYASNVSIKRERFLDVGGFDPDFRQADYEDTDLGWRLHQRGLRLIYEPAAIARHLHRYEWSDIERRYASRAEAEQLMSVKHSWFSPWFYERIRAHTTEPPASRLWPLVVDYVPARARPLRRLVEARADRWYHQQLAPVFLEAWERAGRRRSGPLG
jgi:GT2 family glycosyltransferase